jgi:hypothetical protein
MDLREPGAGARIAAIGGLTLLVTMSFLPWFQKTAPPGITEEAREQAEQQAIVIPMTESYDAWQSFQFLDLLLLSAVILAVGLAVLRWVEGSAETRRVVSLLVAGIGFLAAVLVLYRVINPVDYLGQDLDREFGLWLGLLASTAVAIGGWLAMREEGITFGRAADQFGDRFSGRAPPPPDGSTPPSPPSA